MRCITKSKIYGACVLNTHIGGQHVNGQGARWDASHGSTKRLGKQYWCYLNREQGRALTEQATAQGTTPGNVIKGLVLEYLEAIGAYQAAAAEPVE